MNLINFPGETDISEYRKRASGGRREGIRGGRREGREDGEREGGRKEEEIESTPQLRDQVRWVNVDGTK